MNKKMIKLVSIITAFILAFSALPIEQILAFASEPDVYALKNDYISVTVSAKNGGFAISTGEGNRLIKSDNNKKLLYHSDEYDTSFASFEVSYPKGKVKEYVFGGDYSFLSLGGNNLTTTQDATGITSVWTVDKLTFTQRIELANIGSAEHGMVSLSYKVTSGRSDTVKIKQRLLLDTALGEQDFAYYEVVDINNNYRHIKTEQVIESKEYIPLNFFAYDDSSAPSVTAYTVNSANALPYKVAFAHWNNIAATAFDFAPDTSMTFTNKDNLLYQTADSAYALYYDMGDVSASEASRQVVTNYGVYSNFTVSHSDNVAINISSPLSLSLSADRKEYKKVDASLPGKATFAVQAQLENYYSDSANEYTKATVAFYTSKGITPLDGAGNELITAPSYQEPYTVDFMNFAVGQTKTSTFYFRADVGNSAAYRKVEIRVFDTSKDTVGTESNLVQENLIGSTTFYILCPGGDGNLPKITFTGREPKILYNEGTRHLMITGNNIGMLNGDKSQYSLYAYNKANSDIKYKIESQNIMFPDENVLDVIFTDTMAPGVYDLKFELTSEFADTLACNQVLTAPALTVTMSDDLQYRNNYYGIVAVVQEGKQSNAKYLIKSYKDEQEFNKDKSKYTEVLLTFRGEFVKTEEENEIDGKYVATSIKSTDSNGNSIVSNLISINNCIDFEGGTLSIYYKSENRVAKSVYVDFDGSLYTSVERTSIWKGKAALTEIKNGEEYSLVPYNDSGERMSGFNDNAITLIWPNALGLGQTLAGMIFKMTYGTLGIMYDTDKENIAEVIDSPSVIGHVLSFSAALDLGFLIPESKLAKDPLGRDIKVGTELYWISEDPSGELRALWDKYMDETKKSHTQDGKQFTEGQASVVVDNILFGCGKGFIGVKFEVELALPAYIDAMPSIQGKLSVNTIGNWALGVKGKCQFTAITFEVDLAIKSYNNIPIPDKFYLYVEGFEPGINIDGFGVIWITGGGGGFDDLYDTIFAANGVPPLKLLISVALDVFKVLSARADLYLSLRGIGLNVDGVKIKKTNIEVFKKIQLQFDWYPDYYFIAALGASYYDIIVGQGYIVIIDNEDYEGFFEAFIRGTLKIPSAIPIVGGIELAQVDFGLNSEKIWGAATTLGDIGVSVVYYWGEDIDISLKKGKNAQPTFPELLDCSSIPVYYDAESDRTLYMSIGSNIVLASMAEITEDVESTPRLLASVPSVFSNAAKNRHIVNSGTYSGKKFAYTVSYDANGIEDAKAIAQGFTIEDNEKNKFNLEFYSQTANNLNTANANITYDEKTKRATLGVVLTKIEDFNKDWEITTGIAADVILFEVGSIPELTSLKCSLNNQSITINWAGIELDKLDSLNFFLTKDPNGEEPGRLISTLKKSEDITSKSMSFEIPADMSSGDYYLRAVYSQEDAVNGVLVTDTSISYTNSNQPTDPSGVVITNCGDLSYNVELTSDDVKADGYLVNVYELKEGKPEATDIVNMVFDKEDGKLPPISVGGSYSGFDKDGNTKTYGLTAGKTYQVGVIAYKYIDKDSDGNIDCIVYGNEVPSNSEILKDVTTPKVNIIAQTPYKTITHKEWGLDQNGKAAEIDVYNDTFNTSDVEFAVSSDSKISGKWYVDDFDYTGDFTDTNSFAITLLDLSEGAHTLNINGKDDDGDGFRVPKVFVVDTLSPKLLLTSPINGSFFREDGTLDISGITDKDAVFTVAVDGEVKVDGRTLKDLSGKIDSDGVFNFQINVDKSVSTHLVTITVSDEGGNKYTEEVRVQNIGLSNIDRISIYSNGIQYTNGNLILNSSGSTIAGLSLVAETKNSSFAINDNDLVVWDAKAVSGSAEIDDIGVLTAAANSIGYVTGELRVAENASMTAAATFGADVFNKPISEYYTLTLGAEVGGSVSGSGRYVAGTKVNITAIPSSGYKFKGWSVVGKAAVADASSAQTTIIMPKSDVTVVAEFEYINGTYIPPRKTVEQKPLITETFKAKSGEKSVIAITAGMNKNNVVVCTMVDGVEYRVAMSTARDGNMYFIAPIDGEYYLREYEATFTDISAHWAKECINFAYARGLFAGVSDKLFDPEGKMTRAMFVTVLGRLQGIDESIYHGSSYKDVTAGQWYAPFVEWASQNGIISGYGGGYFGTNDKITREQMCVILERYIKIAGKTLLEENKGNMFEDSGEISPWAQRSVQYAQRTGLVQGIGNNIFNPSGYATRAEVAKIFERLIVKIIESK